jgi:hypothetical protein
MMDLYGIKINRMANQTLEFKSQGRKTPGPPKNMGSTTFKGLTNRHLNVTAQSRTIRIK